MESVKGVLLLIFPGILVHMLCLSDGLVYGIGICVFVHNIAL